MLKTRSGRRPSQDEGELEAFVHLLQDRGTASYLEIGARHGDTFFEVMCALPPGAVGVAVDLPGGNWGTPKSAASLSDAIADLVARGYRVRAIFGDSRDPAVIEQVAALGPYDAVLIDGDHRYQAVKADWEAYGPMGRLVAFHDIAGDGETTRSRDRLPVEVPRLWREIKRGREVIELIEPGSTMGIGVVIR